MGTIQQSIQSATGAILQAAGTAKIIQGVNDAKAERLDKLGQEGAKIEGEMAAQDVAKKELNKEIRTASKEQKVNEQRAEQAGQRNLELDIKAENGGLTNEELLEREGLGETARNFSQQAEKAKKTVEELKAQKKVQDKEFKERRAFLEARAENYNRRVKGTNLPEIKIKGGKK